MHTSTMITAVAVLLAIVGSCSAACPVTTTASALFPKTTAACANPVSTVAWCQACNCAIEEDKNQAFIKPLAGNNKYCDRSSDSAFLAGLVTVGLECREEDNAYDTRQKAALTTEQKAALDSATCQASISTTETTMMTGECPEATSDKLIKDACNAASLPLTVLATLVMAVLSAVMLINM